MQHRRIDKMKTHFQKFLVLGLLLLATASLRAEAPANFKVGEFTFTRPAKWEWIETTSSMRKAQLKIPGADGASAEVVFFEFGPRGAGDVKANVDRWLRQFDPHHNDNVNETNIGKIKVTFVQTEGTYHSGMPGGPTTPMSDYALMGAIMESESGNVFVKMTGPKGLVKSSMTEFKKMIESGPGKE
jgi:hypothetical protein